MNKTVNHLKERIPLMKEEWLPLYRAMTESRYAPRFNTETGDRLTEDDHSFIKNFEYLLKHERNSRGIHPPEEIIEYITEQSKKSQLIAERTRGKDLKTDFFSIKPMTRTDMQANLHLLVPQEISLDRLVVNPTSGTTGEPIQAPNHPRAVGCYDAMIPYALYQNGLSLQKGPGRVAAVQVCLQQKTITYATVHSYLDGAGFAKINLMPGDFLEDSHRSLYLNEMRPQFLSGDPFVFEQMMRMNMKVPAGALLSTALFLSPELKADLEQFFGVPVINFYSLNETGPLAFSLPSNRSGSKTRLRQISPDIFLEVVDANGLPVEEGTEGDLLVTGGRNPFLPLLRYRTGDRVRIWYNSPGDALPEIELCESRRHVNFFADDGSIINPIDIARLIRFHPVRLFSCIQHKDGSVTLRLTESDNGAFIEQLKQQLHELFHHKNIKIEFNLFPQVSKFIPFVQEAQGRFR